MIYGRFGDPATIVRRATLEDVRELERREPDKDDEEMVAVGSYLLCVYHDTGQRFVSHIAYLRADRSIDEIREAIEATDAQAK